MPPSFLMITHRKPGLTMAEFKHHYENVHVPLIQEIAGSTFPSCHTRHYVERDPDGPAGTDAEESNTNTPSVLVQGDAKLMDWDCLTEIVFKDDAHFQAFYATTGQGEGLRQREADEEKFLDRGRITAIKQEQVSNSTNPAK